MKYYVFYVEGCEDKSISFDKKGEAEDFMDSFLKKYEDNRDDNWIDSVFYGLEMNLRIERRSKIKGPKDPNESKGV